MKIKSLKYILAIAFSAILLSSCLDDLDTKPLNKNVVTKEKVYSTADGYRGVLAKCYASLVLTGQEGPSGAGDLTGEFDEGYSGFTRALFYLQECTTDELILHSGTSQDTPSLLYMNWNQSTKVIRYPYYRLYMAIAYCNEFLQETTEGKLHSRGLYEELKGEYEYYIAEARFIRAYCYTMLCDLYGSVPFVDETMKTGTTPHQKTRKEIYDYIVSEMEDIDGKLKAPGANQYARIDQVAGWFLLSRVYLNSQTWVGENQYEKAYQYAKKVIDSGKYPLAADYRHIFLADNNTCPEIIWSLVQDAEKSPNHAGTNFLIKALANGTMNTYYPTGVNNTWGNARMATQLIDKFDAADQTFDPNDIWGNNKKDKRAQFFSLGHTKETWIEGKPFQNSFTNGYACMKWRNVKKDGSTLAPGGTTYSSVDYPMFRTADAYLMAAEAILRGASGSRTDALAYINEVRDRAYLSGAYGSGASGRISDAQMTLDFVLDERARELHTESVRRTDLIRFKKFTKGYNWDWKGSDGGAGNYIGKDIDDKYNLFPIPQDEFTVNPYLTQNPDFQ